MPTVPVHGISLDRIDLGYRTLCHMSLSKLGLVGTPGPACAIEATGLPIYREMYFEWIFPTIQLPVAS